jgi:hypothetical protein
MRLGTSSMAVLLIPTAKTWRTTCSTCHSCPSSRGNHSFPVLVLSLTARGAQVDIIRSRAPEKASKIRLLIAQGFTTSSLRGSTWAEIQASHSSNRCTASVVLQGIYVQRIDATVLWRACNLTALMHSSTEPVVHPFASRHEEPGFNSKGGTYVKPGVSC